MIKDHNKLWDYKIVEEIGRGQSGIVYKVINKKHSLIQALKKISITNMTDSEKRQTYRELKTLQKLNHPNIIKYHESFISLQNLYIVMDYAEDGDLLKLFLDRRKTLRTFTQSELWNIFKQLASALKHLHDQKIIHRDVKLQNIFVHRNTFLIGDLGLSKIIHEKNTMESKRVGTPIYFAPQMIQHQPYSFPVDIWALGCVFYSLINLQHPFEHAILQNLADIILMQPLKPIKSFYSQKMCQVVQMMLYKDPKKRVTADQLVKLMTQKSILSQNVRVISRKYYSTMNNFSSKQENIFKKKVKKMSQIENIEDSHQNLQSLDSRQVKRHSYLEKGIDLQQLLQTVKCMRPRSGNFSMRPYSEQKNSYSNKTQHNIKSNGNSMVTRSLAKNRAFDYITQMMTQRHKNFQKQPKKN